ncbi:MAG TPA: DEAD/DEAH box helicase family protein [Terriglobales bacterium]|nr:DEAD/DEAH box helicase family protein [Terriglobales bacterium]
MKLQFEPKLDFQIDAIEAVCDLFRGQEICRSAFTVTHDPNDPQVRMAFAANDLGVGNRLTLLDDELLANLNQIQIRNGIRPSESLDSGDFTVEMETGTGKTYVYLRTIFELNQRYGFTKFVIVVPSVAIKEGVYKTLDITKDHFKTLYAGVPFDYFLYDSSKLGHVRNFATSPHIQIMVVTVGAINKKDVNNIYGKGANEDTGGEKPIDLIRSTHPILIVDEPQSVDGGLKGQGRQALEAMNPLCTLRYSATHVHAHHMVYRLDAVDAYERKLVKQIEVAAATIEEAHNRPYLRLVEVKIHKGSIFAHVEMDVESGGRVRRRIERVHDGDDLYQTSGHRAVYTNCTVGEIRVERGNQFLELRHPGGTQFLRPGEAFGDVDPLAIQRQMIRRTIKEHLDKEKRLRPQGIKVLSLFFIDSVEKYRRYDADGNPIKGEYAQLFEEEYRHLAKHPDYSTLFEGVDLSRSADEVHNGYFSIDRKKIRGKSVEMYRDTRGDTQADTDTYNWIMRDKEKLLLLDNPLKFIFSHSALKEGWDNPNVFQICSLRDMRSELQRRQTMGRGLRICVNQEGQRVRGDINRLTVIACESYEEFAEKLQQEIEEETGIRFGIVEQHQFAALPRSDAEGVTEVLGFEQSKLLWQALKEEGYIDARGKVQEPLRQALKNETLLVPLEFLPQRPQIYEILRKLAGKLEIKNADERRQVRPHQAVLHSPEFKALWDRIKHRTTYRVNFDNAKLIRDCTKALADAPPIAKTRLQWRKADIAIGKDGVAVTEGASAATVVIDERDIELPDILTELQDRTQLTRRSICRILIESRRLDDFVRNPQAFIQLAAEAINRRKRLAVVDGIKYQRLGDEHYYAQELFETKELTGYLKNMLAETKKSVYEHVVYDSDTEAKFADSLEKNEAVKVYAKLPGWFEIYTPLGGYNPDWAVLIEDERGEHLYFVVETKSGLMLGDLRDLEKAKIECGKAHFEALQVCETPAQYIAARDLNDVLERAHEHRA